MQLSRCQPSHTVFLHVHFLICLALQMRAVGGPPGAIISMTAWNVCVHMCKCVCLQRRPQAAALSLHEMTPFGSTALYSLQKILFSLHRALSHLTLPTTQSSRQYKSCYAHFMGKNNLLGRGWLAQDAISGRAGLIPAHDFSTMPRVFSH